MVSASNQATTKQEQSTNKQAQEQRLNQGKAADNIVRQERANTRQEQTNKELRTLIQTRETTTNSRSRSTRLKIGGAGTEQDRATRRHNKSHQQEVQRHEQKDAVAFKYLNNQNTVQNQRPAVGSQVAKDSYSVSGQAMPEETAPGAASRERLEDGIAAPVVDSASGSVERTEQMVAEAPMQSAAPDLSAETRIGATTHEEIVTLEELIGPQATLTFREKMTELWGILDEGGTTPLDVLAHMPLNVEGQNSMELLMVESPQGVHFVAFLRNSNDFELLATFNRHALLPDNPSRQLIEAALIAFQQIQAIAAGAAEKLSERLKELAEKEGTDYAMLGGIRAACLAAKRSKDGCSRAQDSLVKMLDRYEAEHKEGEEEEVESDEDRPAA